MKDFYQRIFLIKHEGSVFFCPFELFGTAYLVPPEKVDSLMEKFRDKPTALEEACKEMVVNMSQRKPIPFKRLGEAFIKDIKEALRQMSDELSKATRRKLPQWLNWAIVFLSLLLAGFLLAYAFKNLQQASSPPLWGITIIVPLFYLYWFYRRHINRLVSRFSLTPHNLAFKERFLSQIRECTRQELVHDLVFWGLLFFFLFLSKRLGVADLFIDFIVGYRLVLALIRVILKKKLALGDTA